MGFFVWKDQFSVNNSELDRQHQNFFKLLNQIAEHIGRVDSLDCLGESVESLYDYASRHFAEEEDYLAFVGYPNLAQQRKQHAFFKTQIAQFGKNLQSSSAGDLDNLLAFMRDWFLQHILEADQEYARFVAVSGQA